MLREMEEGVVSRDSREYVNLKNSGCGQTCYSGLVTCNKSELSTKSHGNIVYPIGIGVI